MNSHSYQTGKHGHEPGTARERCQFSVISSKQRPFDGLIQQGLVSFGRIDVQVQSREVPRPINPIEARPFRFVQDRLVLEKSKSVSEFLSF